MTSESAVLLTVPPSVICSAPGTVRYFANVSAESAGLPDRIVITPAIVCSCFSMLLARKGFLARHPGQVALVGDAQRDQIGTIDAKLVGDAMDLAFLRGRDRLVSGRHLEQAMHQGKLL